MSENSGFYSRFFLQSLKTSQTKFKERIVVRISFKRNPKHQEHQAYKITWRQSPLYTGVQL
jgi:hypothetical protein